jgi:hypothetical protein
MDIKVLPVALYGTTWHCAYNLSLPYAMSLGC